MITIYHNPRCRKSREGLAVLEESGKAFQVVHYLNEALTKDDVTRLLRYLDLPPMALIRTNETIWKQEFKGRELSDEALVDAMLKYPKLIERPIVVKDQKAVIGRPAEKILELLHH